MTYSRKNKGPEAPASPCPPARPIALPDEAATMALGRRLARILQRGDLIALNGSLGLGKTVLARGIIGAFLGRVTVPSPTFTLVQVYETDNFPITHVDLYRLEKPEDAFELGLEEALDEGVVLMEWPERLGGSLPADRLDVTLSTTVSPSGIGRIAHLSGSGRWTDRVAGV